MVGKGWQVRVLGIVFDNNNNDADWRRQAELRKGMARVFALAVSSSYHHHRHGRRLLFVTLKMHRKLGAQDGKKCSESGLTISSRRSRRHPLLGHTYAHPSTHGGQRID